jgi:4-hydroxybenzoate polyprenyltransferase
MVIGKVVRISSIVINLAKQTNWLTFHLHTIWLITRNDLKSIVLPETAFGTFSALSGPLLTTNNNPSLTVILARIPRVVLWNWLNVLIFDVANQRLPNSVLEDSVNKPWRALPSRRITPSSARRLLLFLIPVVFFATIYLGGVEETVLMMVLTWMYNDLEGADENYIARNLINCAGFMCYSSGTTIVAAGYGQHTLSSRAYTWLGIVGGIVFSTLQMQDMSDVEGDKARGRRTLPIVHGDRAARWSIAIPVTIWSFFCPWFWEVEKTAWVTSLAVGGLLVWRVLMLRSVPADKATWKVWCFWTIVLYVLPLFKNHSVFVRF